eukprot:TRINITY_DN32272_c0_g1_i1.p1 TRINITY_DN32272_c0_g1~~TRINITY_DN32272_c0_g1_i1.p1  ORF type:complete len:121 (-),score=3.49 TRINITY_DN32272_c0_g1_i1:11-373(-)
MSSARGPWHQTPCSSLFLSVRHLSQRREGRWDGGSGAWIGTNQVPRSGDKVRGRLIKPGGVGSGYRVAPARRASGAGGILSLLNTRSSIRNSVLILKTVEQIGRAVQQECRDRSRMPSSA